MNSGLTRPRRLSGTFVRLVSEPGRYGDGRGGHGLSLLVKATSTGRLSKTWGQRLRLNGRPFNLGLGSFPLVRLEEARETAIENARAVRAGIDLAADRRRRASIPTFVQAAERTMDLHAATWKDGGRTARIWRARLEQYAHPSIGGMRVDSITTSDVLAILMPIWASKRETATKLLSYIRAVMKWAVAQGYREDNPAGEAVTAALPRGGVQRAHFRALAWRDVPAALAKIQGSNAAPTTKLCFEFMVLCAVRSGEARHATWAEINLDAEVWTIPASRTKTGREHRVPLSDPALCVLAQAREYNDGSGLVFPSPTGKAMSDNTLSKALRDHGIPAVPHGFRSSFRDWCGDTGKAREVAEASLAHQVGNAVERAYARSDMLARRRELMVEWAEAISPTK